MEQGQGLPNNSSELLTISIATTSPANWVKWEVSRTINQQLTVRSSNQLNYRSLFPFKVNLLLKKDNPSSSSSSSSSVGAPPSSYEFSVEIPFPLISILPVSVPHQSWELGSTKLSFRTETGFLVFQAVGSLPSFVTTVFRALTFGSGATAIGLFLSVIQIAILMQQVGSSSMVLAFFAAVGSLLGEHMSFIPYVCFLLVITAIFVWLNFNADDEEEEEDEEDFLGGGDATIA